MGIVLNTKNITPVILLTNAESLINRDGISSFSIRKLAMESDVSIGSIYRYFPQKSAILLELTKTYWNDLILQLSKITHENLQKSITILLNYIETEKSQINSLLNHPNLFSGKENSSAKEVMTLYKNKVKEYFSKAIQNDDFLKNKYNSLMQKNIVDLAFNLFLDDITTMSHNLNIFFNIIYSK